MSVTLTVQPQRFLLQRGDAAIEIDRASGQIVPAAIEKIANAGSSGGATPQPVVGVLGILDLPASKHLIVARTADKVGMLGNAPVFRVKSTEIIGFHGEGRDHEYVQLVRSHLSSATLFFSPAYDLTSSAQRTSQILEQQGAQAPTSDDEFFWNYEVSRELFAFPQFVLPVIFGIVSTSSMSINGTAVEFAVVSRRSRHHAGTRYFRRGLDENGFAANFNETEQLLFVGDRKFSFLQTRGSVPALWSEVNDLQYKPQLRIGDLAASVEAAAKHFNNQEKKYGEQYLVNLVNQSGHEKPVKDVYEAVVQQLNDPHLHYIYFDFHHECSKMRWHRVQLLVDQLVEMGFAHDLYFETGVSGKPVRYQTGVVRTNCMDCLDRTNVVQSTLALFALEKQLESAGVLGNGARISSDPKFTARFRNIWADNADGVSCAYSGTGALKTDFTRTGKRSKLGALQDLRNSILRYYRNNFSDGPRQDGYSLFLGEYVPRGGEHPFVDRRSLGVQTVPYLFGGCLLVAVLSSWYPSERHSTFFNIIVTLAFAAVAGWSLKFIARHGLQYVSWPKLTNVRFVKWTPQGYQIEGEHRSTKEE